MKTRLLFLILGLGFGVGAFGQYTITGLVTDSKTGQPVPQVNILTNSVQGATSTGADGKYSLSVNRLPVTLRFSHIAYEPKSLTISKKPENPVLIKLDPRTESIGEVVIEGGKYIQALKRENFYVGDYEFDQDRIWVIGYADKSILKPQLIAMDLDGHILQKLPVSGRTKLYRDAFGNVHLMNKESIAAIDYQDGQIITGEPKMFTGWEQNLFDLQMVLGKSGIFKWVYNDGTYCEYAMVNFRDTVAEIIHKSYDRRLFKGEAPAKTFRHSPIPRIQAGAAFGGSGSGEKWDPSDAFTARAQEQLDYRPIITHIFRYRNNYLIFEDRGCNLWKYDLKFVDPVHLTIAEPKDAKNTDLLQDAVTGNLYLYYTVSGNDFLEGIDPLTGTVLFTRKLDRYHYAGLVKVYNNRIWFTHQNPGGSALVNLYSTEIGGN